MATIREAFDYASKNPNSDFAKSLAQLASSGALDIEARKNGIDLTPFKPVPNEVVKQPTSVSVTGTDKKRIDEKILGFTGGDVIAKGLGQSLADTNVNLLGLAPGDSVSTLLSQTQKVQGEQQQKLIEAIRKNKAEGKDTLRLEKALSDLTGAIVQTGDTAEQLYNPNQITDKQIVGDALQLATTVVGAGQLPGTTKTITNSPGVIKGVVQGVKTGTKVGAAYGASSGVASGLKQDLSASDIAKKGVEGTLIGGVTGGILGGFTGGISGKINAKQIAKENFAIDLVSPKATEAVKIQALKEGRVTEQGLLEASKILPSKRDNQLAEVVKNIVDINKTPTQNLNLIDAKVSEINSGVKAYIKANKVPFNTNQLTKQLNNGKDELRLIFAGDKQAEKTYTAVVKEFLKHVESKDTSGLFEARQTFDKVPAIKKLLDSQGLGENAKKEIVLTVRGQANKYVADLLPAGNKYRDTLLKESKMIEAIQNIAEKNSNTIGINKLEMLTKKYPILKGIAGGLAAGAGLGAIGLGASVINSSD